MKKTLLLMLCCLHAPWSLAQNDSGAFVIPGTESLEVVDQRNGRAYELYVKLPSSYWRQENSARRYPVMYITDARVNFPLMEASTLFAMGNGDLVEVILVGISWQKGITSRASRIRDFTPTVEESWRETTGGAGDFLDFLTQQAFPLVESRYRVDPDNRSYAGNSLGGLFGAWVLLTRPDTFRQYLIGSPSLFFDEKYVLRLEASGEAERPTDDTRVFIAVGAYENPVDAGIASNLVADAAELAARIEAWGLTNVDLKFLSIPEAIHDMAFPTTAVHGTFWLFRQ